MRIAVAGGTFDPVHFGHIDPIVSQIEPFGWDRVLFVPANVQPFKQGKGSASSWDRHSMLVLATEEDPRLEVSTVELERTGVSYAVDTLEILGRQFGGARIDWVIGSDNVVRLLEWRDLDRIFELANFVVLRRGDGDLDLPGDLRSRLVEADDLGEAGGIGQARNSLVSVSATEIRRRRREGISIEGMVPFRVERYIEHNGLYVSG